MTHPYATNLSERQRVPLFIAVCGFLCAIGLGKLFTIIGWLPPAWIDVPSTAAFYQAGSRAFNKHIWKWKWLRRTGAITTPVLEGAWLGEVRTSHDEYAQAHPVSAEICQDWTDISVILGSRHSKSHSVIGSLMITTETVLSYEYLNEPAVTAAETMHTHRGTASLVLSPDGSKLEGHYYSGRDRRNCGEIRLHRSSGAAATRDGR
jgi:SMODS-associating 2TM, beta-strand rich effector domain